MITALSLLRQPQEVAWNPKIADEMLHLTLLSIGIKCQPWAAGLVLNSKLRKPKLAKALDEAEKAVNAAYFQRNMRELSIACKQWFNACHRIQQGGDGRELQTASGR